MLYTAYSLSGDWEMNYQQEIYRSTVNPWSRNANPGNSDEYSGTEKAWDRDDTMPDAVPGYWEDMTDKFALLTPYYLKLKINPDYGLQRYPIAGFAPDMALPNIVGNFFYRRSFVVDKADVPAALWFGGVQNACSVWLNDVYLGRHEGYSAPFEMAIPAGVLCAGENTVVLSVSNYDLVGYQDEPVSGLMNRAANQYTGGVYGDVELRLYSSPLRDVTILVSNDCSSVSVEPETTEKITFCWAVYDGKKLLRSGEADGKFCFDTTDLPRWSPEDPHTLQLVLAYGDASLERTFGVRRLVGKGKTFYFNGKPYYLRGICEHGYFPETVHPTTDPHFYRNLIRTIKNLGFNFIRFHTYIPNEEYMQAADELGILMQVESPNNTTYEEWEQIITFCRRHPSVIMYSCGNELLMDEPFIAHLHKCADAVHTRTDSMFSPISALRGVEYYFLEPEQEAKLLHTPFTHHPERLKTVTSFSDIFKTVGHMQLSYECTDVDPAYIDRANEVFDVPLVGHEICIQGTYTDLTLADRYADSNIRLSPMFSTLKQHLKDKGMLQKAPLFFRNSCRWQQLLRKHCFEHTRLCRTMAGYEFLGPIDTHWHTFGYDVGMMNEFYELKPGETVRNVRMYNSDTVLLNDLNTDVNFTAGDDLQVKISVSHFGPQDLQNAALNLRLTMDRKLIANAHVAIDEVKTGEVTDLYTLQVKLPATAKPAAMELYTTLEAGDTYAENCWDLYLFPENTADAENLVIADKFAPEELLALLQDGKDVLLLGGEPFVTQPMSFRISLAGRTNGNLATVITDHPALGDLPHEGFCGWQFRRLLEGGKAICFESENVPFDPIIEVASSHKYVIRQSALFEYRVGAGRLLVCGMNFTDTDPAARWLKNQLIAYANSADFDPDYTLTESDLLALINANVTAAAKNTNVAFNANDKTAIRKKKK